MSKSHVDDKQIEFNHPNLKALREKPRDAWKTFQRSRTRRTRALMLTGNGSWRAGTQCSTDRSWKFSGMFIMTQWAQ